MGQAKRRGSFEQRKKQAIERDKKLREEYDRKLQAEWEALTPEERQEIAERKSRQQEFMNSYMGFFLGAIGRGVDRDFFSPPKLKNRY